VAAQEGGVTMNATAILSLKEAVRSRDGHRCTECGTTAAQHIRQYGKTLDVHRVEPGSDYTLAGYVTLCRTCHNTGPLGPPVPGNAADLTHLRADAAWINRVNAEAERLGLSLSAYIRLAVNERMERTASERGPRQKGRGE
jgi:hypothetical protein